MSIISIRDNENNIWKRNTQKKTKKTNKQVQKRARGDKNEKVKEWELNDFVVHLS